MHDSIILLYLKMKQPVVSKTSHGLQELGMLLLCLESHDLDYPRKGVTYALN